jgi:type IV pilus assembly protein PilB
MEEIFKLIPVKYALKHCILPLGYDNSSVKIAMTDSNNCKLLNELQFIFNKRILPEVWDEGKIKEEINKRYQISEDKIELNTAESFEYIDKESEKSGESIFPKNNDQSVIKIVNNLISDAIHIRASDIHIESYEDDFRVRLRVDGKLIEHEKPPKERKQAIISRLKIMANMDIAEKRRPQDGRIRVQNGSKAVDIRVSTLPTDFGEKVVLRILDKSSLKLSLDALGFENEVLENFKKVLRLPYGMILVTGPTGSGKTTTLYSALNYINSIDANIITIEDPIEYNLQGINQTMVRSDIGLTFASILRTILRQDPNIIMVGEIRDSETAEIAIRAALTGHLVLSTLHTNDALSTIIRLIDMGIESFLVACSLKMVVAQRLVRKTCPYCKQKKDVEWDKLNSYQLSPALKSHSFYQGKGCSKCNQTGFSGREAIIEQIIIDDDFSELITNNASVLELGQLAKRKGLSCIKEVALKKAIAGITSLEEVIYETIAV